MLPPGRGAEELFLVEEVGGGSPPLYCSLVLRSCTSLLYYSVVLDFKTAPIPSTSMLQASELPPVVGKD